MLRYLFMPAVMLLTSCATSGDPASLTANLVLLEEIETTAESLLESATEDGQYVVASAGIELTNGIDEAEIAAQRLIDDFDSDLNRTLNTAIGNLSASLDELEIALEDGVVDATGIGISVENAVADLRFWDNEAYITDYRPKVVLPTGTQDIQFELFLINGREADPEIRLPDGTLATRTDGDVNRYVFSVPRDSFNTSTDDVSLETLTVALSKERFLRSPKVVERDIGVLRLSNTLGTYEFSSLETERRRITEMRTVNLGQFKGTNREKDKAVRPRAGWRIDTTFKPIHRQGKGRSADCRGYREHTLSEGGFSFFARVDKIVAPDKIGPGYVNCTVTFREYDWVDEEVPGEQQSGDIAWTGDLLLKMSENTSFWELTVRTFDGRERTFIAGGADSFYTVTSNSRAVLLSPVVPQNLARALRN